MAVSSERFSEDIEKTIFFRLVSAICVFGTSEKKMFVKINRNVVVRFLNGFWFFLGVLSAIF
jgi:hypothetical protein